MRKKQQEWFLESQKKLQIQNMWQCCLFEFKKKVNPIQSIFHHHHHRSIDRFNFGHIFLSFDSLLILSLSCVVIIIMFDSFHFPGFNSFWLIFIFFVSLAQFFFLFSFFLRSALHDTISGRNSLFSSYSHLSHKPI